MKNSVIKTKFSFAKIALGVVGLFALVSLGSFGYSFLKSKPNSTIPPKDNEEITEEDQTDETDTSGGTTVDSNLMACKKGTIAGQSEDNKIEYTGKEKITYENKTGETCCYVMTDYIDGEISAENKTCEFLDGSDSSVMYKKINGRYTIWGAVIKDGDIQCNYIYSMEGVFESKSCF